MIELSNVRLNHFPKSSLNLSIRKGEIVGISGPSGAGKSTLLRYLAGLEGAVVTENGLEKSAYFCPDSGIHVGMVFQHEEDNLIFSTLREDVRFGLRSLGRNMTENVFQQKLAENGLEGCGDRSYTEMSSGELERAALVSICSQQLELLLLDEVLSSHPARTAREILTKVIRQVKDDGSTVILVTHDPELLKLCDKQYYMDQGNVLSEIPEWHEPEALPDPFETLLAASKCSKLEEWQLPGPEPLRLTEYTGASGVICLRLDDVCYAHSDRDNFTNLSCLLRNGGLYHLTGSLGSGKSTLLKIMAGLLYADSGEVRVFDQPFPNSGKKGWDKIGRVNHQAYLNEIRRHIGYMGHNAEKQLFRETVFEDVGYAPQNFGLSGEALKAAQVKALYNMGIDESNWQRSSRKLSGGEQRRVALAGIIAVDPDILLLDDPYSELDRNGIELLNRVILDRLEAGKTVVIAEEK